MKKNKKKKKKKKIVFSSSFLSFSSFNEVLSITGMKKQEGKKT
jgi:hypothetical protein